jgi:hypothetical protein
MRQSTQPALHDEPPWHDGSQGRDLLRKQNRVPEWQQVQGTRWLVVPVSQYTAEDGRILIVGVIGNMMITDKEAIQICLTRSLCPFHHETSAYSGVFDSIGRLNGNSDTHRTCSGYSNRGA